jgi:amino acid adenylation domain-containing protein
LIKKIKEIIRDLSKKGVLLEDNQGALKIKSFGYKISKDELLFIKANKSEILQVIGSKRKVFENNIIPVTTNEVDHPLSFAQKRLWIIDQFQGETAEYNMPRALSVTGDFDPEMADQALGCIIERHQVLRSVFLDADIWPRQQVQSMASLSFEMILSDVSGLLIKEQHERIVELANKDAQTPFNLKKDLMVRSYYINCGKNDSGVSHGVLLFNMHHIASDGWSMSILVREFVALYQALKTHKNQGCFGKFESPMLPLQIQYSDYAHWQQAHLKGEVLESQINYWQEQLVEMPSVHSLPLDYPRPGVKSYVGARVHSKLSSELSVSLKVLAQREGMTLFMLLHAGLSLLLSLHSNSDDIVLGTAVANRRQAEVSDLIGFFVNAIVLRVDTNYDKVRDYLAHVRKVNIDAQSNQDVPFEQVIELAQISRSQSHTPLFQIMFNMDSNEQVELKIDGLQFEPFQQGAGKAQAKFDLQLSATDDDSGLYFSWTYDTSLFSQAHIEQIDEHFHRLLANLETNVDGKLNDIEILGSSEVKSLLSTLNDTKADYPENSCIQELFEQQAKNNPNKIALVFEDKKLTYRQLNEHANQLAHYLIEHYHVVPDVLVGLCIDRSLEMVIGILGILKAGGAYVPLDPDYPQTRIDYMLEDSRLGVVLTQLHVQKTTSFGDADVVCLDDFWDMNAEIVTSNLDKSILGLNSSHLAYVIYTSGSTGKPKGVLQTHLNVCRLFYVNEENFCFTSNDVWCLFHSFAFDFSVWEIWGGLAYGGKVVIPSYIETRDIEKFIYLCKKEGITILNQTPSAFKHLTQYLVKSNYVLSEVRTVIFGGEALTKNHVSLWIDNYAYQNTNLINMYGITETTVHVTYKKLEPDLANGISIGKPLKDQMILLLNKNLSLVPFGSIGEIYVSGAGLARGYLNRSQLTAERFINNPYYDVNKQGSSKRLYKTGDLAYYCPNGDLVFMGRIDDQVKVRGFRIELGELETRLCQQSGVKQAVVIAKSNEQGDKQLIAYLVPDTDKFTAIEQNEQHSLISSIDVLQATDWLNTLKQQLKSELPDYMVPTFLIALNQLPLTINGKLDKKTLLTIDVTGSQSDYVLPSNDIEVKLCQIWQEVLGNKNVSITERYFDIGGNSLNALSMISKVNEVGIKIGLADLWQNNTISQLAALANDTHSNEQTQNNDMAGELVDTIRLASTGFVTKSIILPSILTETQIRYKMKLFFAEHAALRQELQANNGEYRMTEVKASTVYFKKAFIFKISNDLVNNQLTDKCKEYITQLDNDFRGSFDGHPLAKIVCFTGAEQQELTLMLHELLPENERQKIISRYVSAVSK